VIEIPTTGRDELALLESGGCVPRREVRCEEADSERIDLQHPVVEPCRDARARLFFDDLAGLGSGDEGVRSFRRSVVFPCKIWPGGHIHTYPRTPLQ
jgi:hypothetical protein